MALSDPYANVQRFRAQTGAQGSVNDEVLESQLKHASWLIDQESGFETFNKGTAVGARDVFPIGDEYGNAQPVLIVPPIASTDDLEIIVDTDGDGDFADETVIDSDDYELLPLDAALRPQPAPWTEIRLHSYATYSATWVIGSRVRIYAIWGWPSVPEAVVNLCVELTKLLRGEGIFATNRISEMGGTEETVSLQARALIRRSLQLLSPTGGIAVG